MTVILPTLPIAVLIAIEKLAFNQTGLATEGSYQILDEWCIWEVANHTVVYEITRIERHLYIWVIRPIE